MNKLHATAARLFGYTIQGQGFTRTHHAMTLRAALQWAACYPAATIKRRGRFVASKTTH